MGNAVIGSLRANLGLDSSKFQKGARGVKDPLKAMKRQFLAVSAAAVAFGGAITAAALKGARQIDELAKASRRLDASIGGFRAVQLAADEAGISLSSLTNDVQTMNRELSRAGEGGPVDDALAKLGISAKELLALDIDERLATIADRIQELGLSSGEATALLQDFGVRNREMALLMVQGGGAIRDARSDIQDYGLALNEVDSERIEHANDQISRLSIISERFGQQLALVVVPALGRLAEAFTNSMREGGLLRSMIDGFANNLVRISTYITTAVGLLGVRLVGAMTMAAIATGSLSAALVTLRGAIVRTGFGVLVVGIGEVVYQLGLAKTAASEYEVATDAATTAENQLKAAVSGASGVMPGAAQNAVTLAKSRVELAKANYQAAVSELEAREAMREDTENAPNSPFRDIALALGGANLDRRASDVADKLSELREAESSLREVADIAINADYGGAGGTSPIVQADTELQNLLRALDPTIERTEQYAAAVAILNDGLTSGRLTVEEYNANIEKVKELYGEVERGAGGAARGASGLEDAMAGLPDVIGQTQTSADGLRDTFASTFTDILSGTTSVRAGLGQLAAQIGKMALMKGFKALFGNLLGGLSGGGAGLADLLGFNANGTENWAGGLSVVGERGAEIVNMPRGSQVFNAQKSAQLMAAPAQVAPDVSLSVKNVNVLDPSVIEDWLSGPSGERVIMNTLRANGVTGA